MNTRAGFTEDQAIAYVLCGSPPGNPIDGAPAIRDYSRKDEAVFLAAVPGQWGRYKVLVQFWFAHEREMRRGRR